jgi:hypothetical protein
MEPVQRLTLQGTPRVDSKLIRRVDTGTMRAAVRVEPVTAPTAFPRLATLIPIASSFLTSWSRFFPDSTLRQYAPRSAAPAMPRTSGTPSARAAPPRLEAGDILPSLELTQAWAAFSR